MKQTGASTKLTSTKVSGPNCADMVDGTRNILENGHCSAHSMVDKNLRSARYGIYNSEGMIDINHTLEQSGIDDSPGPAHPSSMSALGC